MRIIISYLYNIRIRQMLIYDAVPVVQKARDEHACSYDVYKHILQLAWYTRICVYNWYMYWYDKHIIRVLQYMHMIHILCVKIYVRYTVCPII